MKIHQHEITNLIPKMFSSKSFHAFGKSLFVKSPFTQAFFTTTPKYSLHSVASPAVNSHLTLSKSRCRYSRRYGGVKKALREAALWVFLVDG